MTLGTLIIPRMKDAPFSAHARLRVIGGRMKEHPQLKQSRQEEVKWSAKKAETVKRMALRTIRI